MDIYDKYEKKKFIIELENIDGWQNIDSIYSPYMGYVPPPSPVNSQSNNSDIELSEHHEFFEVGDDIDNEFGDEVDDFNIDDSE